MGSSGVKGVSFATKDSMVKQRFPVAENIVRDGTSTVQLMRFAFKSFHNSFSDLYQQQYLSQTQTKYKTL